MIGIVCSSNMCENSTRDTLGWEFSRWERFLGAKSMLLDDVSLFLPFHLALPSLNFSICDQWKDPLGSIPLLNPLHMQLVSARQQTTFGLIPFLETLSLKAKIHMTSYLLSRDQYLARSQITVLK